MKTQDILLMKALQLKQANEGAASSDLVDHILEQNPEEAKKALRNICAFITPQLFQEVEAVCGALEFSKRQVIEMALRDFINKANEVMEQVDPYASLEVDEDGHPIGHKPNREGRE